MTLSLSCDPTSTHYWPIQLLFAYSNILYSKEVCDFICSHSINARGSAAFLLSSSHLRNIPTPAPQMAAWAVHAPTSSPFSCSWQQGLCAHSMTPHRRHRVGCFRSSSDEFGHLRAKRESHRKHLIYLHKILNSHSGHYRQSFINSTYLKWLAWLSNTL